jgi:hypothetical protein
MEASSGDPKPTSWTARILAPLLLVVVAAAIVLIVSDSLKSDDDEGSKRSQNQSTTTSGCTPDADQAVKDGFYVVKEGDLMSVIAEKTCISIDRLKALNPNLDPLGLQPQNCVDLIPDGCKALAGNG